MSVWPKPCVRCQTLMYPRKWSVLRAFMHEGRGLCRPCYYRCRKTGELADYELVTHRRTEVLAEWEVLRLDGVSKRDAAGRIGMSFEAFDRALLRARAVAA